MTSAIAGLLDGTLEDLKDLPGFKQPPSGAYQVVVVGFEEKKINEHPAIETKFRMVALLEAADKSLDEKEYLTAGEEFNVAYMMDNETGQGFFKEFLKPIGEKLGTGKISEILEQAKGMELVITVKRTYDEKKDRHYLNLKQVMVP